MALVDVMLELEVPHSLSEVTKFAKLYGFDGTSKSFAALNMRYKERRCGKYPI